MAKRTPAKPATRPARKPAPSRSSTTRHKRKAPPSRKPDRGEVLQLAEPRDAEPFGVSGTEMIGGQSMREEYNPVLMWPNAVRVYDEMRRSSPDVRAALQILKLPILGSTLQINEPADAQPIERQATDLVRWALLDSGRMTLGIQRVIRHLLLGLDFGFAPVEIVWTVDNWENRPIYRPHKLAPRMPRTLKEWMISRDGDLRAMIQYGPNLETGEWRDWTIPADYLCVHVHDREGDNYNGVSVLRPIYKPWWYLNQLEHIDMIAHHRFGAGLPEAKLKDNTRLTPDERRITEATLANIVSSEASFLITPSKLDFNLHQPTGTNTGMAASMEYHGHAIGRAILANFLNNAAEGMNTNRTSALIDLFWELIKALGNELAEDIGRHIIRRICDLNFDMTGMRYPAWRFAKIGSSGVVGLATALKELALGALITPDDSIEDWLRELADAPPLPDEMRRENQPDPVPLVAGEVVGEPGVQPEDVDTDDDAAIAAAMRFTRERDEVLILGMADRILAAGARGQRTISVRDGHILGMASTIRRKRALARDPILLAGPREPVVYMDREYWREPSELERRIVSLAEIPDTIDTASTRLFEALRNIRVRQLEAAATWLESHDDFENMRADQVPMPEAAEIEREIRAMQDALATFGQQQVRLELIRQGAPLQLADTFADEGGALTLDSGAARNRRTLRGALVTAARATSEWMIGDWRADIIDGAVRLRRTGLTGTELSERLISNMRPEADKGIMREVKAKANEAYALGRAREAEARSDIIDRVVQSALLDGNTCRPCAAVDGREFDYGSREQREHAPPYVRCAGKESCRCAQLYLFVNPGDRSVRGQAAGAAA